MRHAVSAGEPLNPEVIRAFESAFGRTIHDGYGQTENTLLVGNFPGAEIRPGSMGVPAPGYDVRGDRRDGQRAAAGEEGDIALRGTAARRCSPATGSSPTRRRPSSAATGT